MKKGESCIAKFMPHFDGSYKVTPVHLQHSTVSLDLPNSLRICKIFHSSQVQPFTENDATLFPEHELKKPGSIIVDDGEEYFIDRIIDGRGRGQG